MPISSHRPPPSRLPRLLSAILDGSHRFIDSLAGALIGPVFSQAENNKVTSYNAVAPEIRFIFDPWYALMARVREQGGCQSDRVTEGNLVKPGQSPQSSRQFARAHAALAMPE